MRQPPENSAHGARLVGVRRSRGRRGFRPRARAPNARRCRQAGSGSRRCGADRCAVSASASSSARSLSAASTMSIRRLGPVGRFLREAADARSARRQLHAAALGRDLAGDHAEQRGLAGCRCGRPARRARRRECAPRRRRSEAARRRAPRGRRSPACALFGRAGGEEAMGACVPMRCSALRASAAGAPLSGTAQAPLLASWSAAVGEAPRSCAVPDQWCPARAHARRQRA